MSAFLNRRFYKPQRWAPITAAAYVAPPAATGTPDATVFTTSTVSLAAASTLNLTNPERGFYGWGGDFYLNNFTAGSLNGLLSQGMSLTIGLVDLSAYVTAAIPQSYLDSLTAKFALVRAAGVKVVIRPVYNYSGSSGVEASLSKMQQDIAALAPVFTANKDVIAFFQAGFAGNFGEWWGTTVSNNAASKLTLMQALMSAWPSSHSICFRYLRDIMTWFPTATTEAKIGDLSNQSRCGLMNDCFLAGPDDSGTYAQGSTGYNVAQMRAYAQAITKFVPFGGETCSDTGTSLRTADSDIMTEGAAYGLSYLNSNYAPEFIKTDTGAWYVSGIITTVKRLMGFRFQIDSVDYPTAVAPGGSAAVTIKARNVGWGRIHIARQLVVSLRNLTSGVIYSGNAGDLRTCPSQATSSTTFSASVSIPADAAVGNYELLLSAPDPNASLASRTQYAIRFANADSGAQAWDAASARFKVGVNVAVGGSPSGSGTVSTPTVSGSLALTMRALPNTLAFNATAPNLGALSLKTITAAKTTKAQGETISFTNIGTTLAAGTTAYAGTGISDGTDTYAAGFKGNWQTSGNGAQYTTTIGTDPVYLYVPASVYSGKLRCTVSIDDGSFATQQLEVSASSNGSTAHALFDIICNAKAAGATLTVTVVQLDAFGAGYDSSFYGMLKRSAAL
jgi:hypothetical protein